MSLLLVRRVTGAPREPLGGFGLLACGILATTFAALSRRLWGRSGPPPIPEGFNIIEERGAAASSGAAGSDCLAVRPPESGHQDSSRNALRAGGCRREKYVFHAAVTLATILFASVVSIPGSPTIAMICLWVLVLGGELLGIWLPQRTSSQLSAFGWLSLVQGRASGTRGLGDSEVLEQTSNARGPLSGVAQTAGYGDLPTGINQQLTRATAEDGSTIVFGVLRCDLHPGQRQEVVHIAFCPPLKELPQLEAIAIGGPKVTVKATLVQTFGICLEVRQEASELAPGSVQLQFRAVAPAPRSKREPDSK